MNRRQRSDLLSQIRRDARCIAGHFQLHYRGIAAEHPRVKSRYGACYEDGLIKIRLNHARTGKPLKYSSLIDTLCHELAHLRHFNHGPEFKDFFLRLLRWSRSEGIYKPGPVSATRAPPNSRQASSARDRRPVAQDLLQRNGIPIFPPSEPADGQRALPWDKKQSRGQDSRGQDSRGQDSRGQDSRGQDSRTTRADSARRQEGTPIPSPMAPDPPDNHPGPTPEQLSLF